MNKEKYCGEVYLELTFWLNVSSSYGLHVSDLTVTQEKPPEKKAPKPVLHNRQYGGPGSFVPTSDLPSSSLSGSGQRPPSSRISSTSGFQEATHNDSFPESLRQSHSLAKLDLYVPPYEKHSYGTHMSAIDRVASDFGELGISDHRRRDSFPVSCTPSMLIQLLIHFTATPW
jgi:hypothetical protein